MELTDYEHFVLVLLVAITVGVVYLIHFVRKSSDTQKSILVTLAIENDQQIEKLRQQIESSSDVVEKLTYLAEQTEGKVEEIQAILESDTKFKKQLEVDNEHFSKILK